MQRNTLPAYMTAALLPLLHYDAYAAPAYASPARSHSAKSTVHDLPEFVVESRKNSVLHMLAYVREYSTLTTYSDTIFMFREKMVDYMIPPSRKSRFKGWTLPRTLLSKSYYRFTNSTGLDSVSDECDHHFSWSDWVGIPALARLPESICRTESSTDTIRGKYSPSEIWNKSGDRLILDVNVLADTTARRWLPGFHAIRRDDIDFERLTLNLVYDNVLDQTVSANELTGYSFEIESDGRGRRMFMFNGVDQQVFVSTKADVYIMEREFITPKEARKWSSRKHRLEESVIYEPPEAPDLDPQTELLIDRVNKVSHEKTRLSLAPDKRLAGRNLVKLNAGQKILKRLKGLLGIDAINAQRKMRKDWNRFRKNQMRINNERNKP